MVQEDDSHRRKEPVVNLTSSPPPNILRAVWECYLPLGHQFHKPPETILEEIHFSSPLGLKILLGHRVLGLLQGFFSSSPNWLLPEYLKGRQPKARHERCVNRLNWLLSFFDGAHNVLHNMSTCLTRQTIRSFVCLV